MTRSYLRFAFASALLPLFLLTMAGLSHAATITVTSLLDTGSGTLRDAINTANTTPTAVDTINFSVSGTITLGSSLPEITNTSPGALTIDGGNAITIDGADSFQIFSGNIGTTLSLQRLTIANGNSASIFTAGGVTSFGTLTINDCTLSGNSGIVSGGVLNHGTMTVTNSTFADNIGSQGGAINNNGGGIGTVINSTFSGNHGTGSQPASIINSRSMTAAKGAPLTVSGADAGFGGAILNFNVITITNSTFSGNEVTPSNPTALDDIVETGGAIYNAMGTVSLKSTILADSVGGNCEGETAVTDAGYNISDDASCPTTSGTSVDSSTTLNLSPAGLANNGGPTDTIALEPNSQAVDFIPVADCTDQSATPAPVTTDQRGEPRPDPGNLNFCDAGAYELLTSYDFVLESDRVQIARSSAANADQVNMGLTFTDLPNPTCSTDDDVLNNGLTVELFAGSCTDLMGTGLSVDLDPFVVHTVNHQSYGTYFLSSPPETVSARMVAAPAPEGTCGKWILNLEVAGLDTPALGLGGTNPFALILESSDLHVFGCFDINNAIVGNQIVAPTKTVRRGVRR
jgi:hypothetical protein